MIFYFSGTGNSRWIAERIARATGDRLIFIPDVLSGRIDARELHIGDDERVGFCFPVHGWQPPRIVRRFMEMIDLCACTSISGDHKGRPYTYAVITCGDNIGRAMEMFEKYIHIDAQFSVIMPESYVCLPFMYTDSQEREQQKIAAAEEQLQTIIDVVTSRTAGVRMLTRGATPWLFSHVLGAFFNARMITDKPFTVDNDTCIGCGICERICPVRNISLAAVGDNPEKKVPTWHCNGSCTCCLACYHHCPRHAINYGSITRRRGQYFFKHQNVIRPY